MYSQEIIGRKSGYIITEAQNMTKTINSNKNKKITSINTHL